MSGSTPQVAMPYQLKSSEFNKYYSSVCPDNKKGEMFDSLTGNISKINKNPQEKKNEIIENKGKPQQLQQIQAGDFNLIPLIRDIRTHKRIKFTPNHW